MSRLDELIEELCPDGVKYVELGQIVNLTMGISPSGNSISGNIENNGIEFHQGKSFFGDTYLNRSNIYLFVKSTIFGK